MPIQNKTDGYITSDLAISSIIALYGSKSDDYLCLNLTSLTKNGPKAHIK
jgi:hypothetical protein